jgi:hypothetical protein
MVERHNSQPDIGLRIFKSVMAVNTLDLMRVKTGRYTGLHEITTLGARYIAQLPAL